MQRLVVFSLMILCWSTLGTAQDSESSAAPILSYPERICALESETQAQTALLAKQAETNPTQRELFEKQIIHLKKQAEINRLEILLEWAEAEGNSNKAAEIRRSLEQWRNPVVRPKPSHVPREAPNPSGNAPGTKDSSR